MPGRLKKMLSKCRTIGRVGATAAKNFGVSLKNAVMPFRKSEERLLINDTSHHPSKARGLFSLLNEVVYLISINSGKNIEIDYRHTEYNDTPDANAWTFCFRPVRNDDAHKRPYRYLFATPPYRNPLVVGKKRYRRILNQVIRDRILLQDSAQNKIEDFIAKNFKGRKVIGVHYRGADTLYPVVLRPPRDFRKASVEEYFNAIDKQLQNGFEAIFLATDDEEVFKKFKARYGDALFSYSTIRSSPQGAVYDWGLSRTAIPLIRTDKRLLCEEGIIDCILLSRCDYLIHGQSNLSCCARYFSPDLPAKNLEEKRYSLIQHLENMVLYF